MRSAMIKRTQAALELAIIFVVVFLFILAIIRIGVWGNAQMVGKVVGFNNSRVRAGSPYIYLIQNGIVNFYENKTLTVGF